MGILKVDNIQKRDGTAIITDGALTATQLRTAGVGRILLNTTNITSGTANVAFNSSIIDTANYKNFEIIVADDGSTKDTEKLIKNHGRMLIRKSGTEPKIRIMGESNNIALLKRCINIVKRSIN